MMIPLYVCSVHAQSREMIAGWRKTIKCHSTTFTVVHSFQNSLLTIYFLQDNDEDIGALESILSWNEQDEADENGNNASTTSSSLDAAAMGNGQASNQGVGATMQNNPFQFDANEAIIAGLSLPLPTPVSEINRNAIAGPATANFSIPSLSQQPQISPPPTGQQLNQIRVPQPNQQINFNTIMQQQSMLQRLQQQAGNPNADPKVTAQLLRNMASVFVRPNANVQNFFSTQQPTQQMPQPSLNVQPQQGNMGGSPFPTTTVQPTPQLQPPPMPLTTPSSSPLPDTTTEQESNNRSQESSSKKRSVSSDAVVSLETNDNTTTKKKRRNKRGSDDTTKIHTNQVTSIISASDTDDRNKEESAPVSAAEKAKANRDRNREHARNTRLRKKVYLEKLKKTVDELCRERDTLVSERAGAANLLVEMHNTRTEVLVSFFVLRTNNEKRRELWSSILDEASFSCTMPVTPYRSFPATEIQTSKCSRVVQGIDGVMADTASLHVMFDSLVDREKYPDGKIQFRYTVVTEDAIVSGNQMMARWAMKTVNATKMGARCEVSKQGMLSARFNSSHRITHLDIMFDVMGFMLQLKQASETETFGVVPNTVQTCQVDSSENKPMVVTMSEPPFTIVRVNRWWEEMTGYTADDVVGKRNCRLLDGSQTDHIALDQLTTEAHFKRCASSWLISYNKSGGMFCQFVTVLPLNTDSRITHFVTISHCVRECTTVPDFLRQKSI